MVDGLVSDALFDGRRIRALTPVDNYTREALAIVIDSAIRSEHVVEAVEAVAARRGAPRLIRVDNVLYREAEGCSGQQVSIASLHRRWHAHQHQTRWPPPRWRSSRP